MPVFDSFLANSFSVYLIWSINLCVSWVATEISTSHHILVSLRLCCLPASRPDDQTPALYRSASVSARSVHGDIGNGLCLTRAAPPLTVLGLQRATG